MEFERIASILSSKSRWQVLRVYCYLDQAYSLRELCRLSGAALRSVQICTEEFIREGLLITVNRGNKKRLQLNPSYKYLSPLMELISFAAIKAEQNEIKNYYAGNLLQEIDEMNEFVLSASSAR